MKLIRINSYSPGHYTDKVILEDEDLGKLYKERDQYQEEAIRGGFLLTQLRYALRDGGPSPIPQFTRVLVHVDDKGKR